MVEAKYARIFGKINDVDYSNLDPRVVELAKEKHGDDLFYTHPKKLLMFQIINEALNPDKYESGKEDGSLFKGELGELLYISGKITHPFNKGIEAWLDLGTLIGKPDSYAIIEDAINNVMDYFEIRAVTTSENVTSRDCGILIDKIEKEIEKHPDLIEIIYSEESLDEEPIPEN